MRESGWMAAAIAAATASTAIAADEPPLAGTRLDVVATGAVTRPPDVAIVTVGVVTQATAASAAMADNARRVAAAGGALADAGVAARDIRTSAVTLRPQYRDADGRPPTISGYEATDQMTIRLRDVGHAGEVLDALVAAGVNQLSGPDLTLDDPAAALDEARSQALSAARGRATLYARAAGLSVARIVRIEEDGGSATEPAPRMMMLTARKSATVIAPGEQQVTATLHVTFELR